MRTILSVNLLVAFGLAAAPVIPAVFATHAVAAAPCRDAKGKFTKCPPPKPVRCKDAKGRFAKCGTEGANPA